MNNESTIIAHNIWAFLPSGLPKLQDMNLFLKQKHLELISASAVSDALLETGLYSDAATNWHFLLGNKQLHVFRSNAAKISWLHAARTTSECGLSDRIPDSTSMCRLGIHTCTESFPLSNTRTEQGQRQSVDVIVFG